MRHHSRKVLFIIGIFLILLFAFFNMAEAFYKLPTDQLYLGTSSSNKKELVFNIDSASYPAFGYDLTNGSYQLGNGFNVDQILEFDIGLASNPRTYYDSANSAFAMDQNALVLGDGSADVELKFNDNTSFASYPAVRYDSTDGAFEMGATTLVLGDGVVNPVLKFNDGTSIASYPAVSYDNTNGLMAVSKDLVIGDGIGTGRKCLKADIGVDFASYPANCYNADEGFWEVTVDGVEYTSYPATATGGGGGGADTADLAVQNDGVKMAICSFRFDTSSPSVVTDRGGCVASIAKNTTGDVNITLETNYFATPPECGTVGFTTSGDTASQVVCTSQFDGFGATTLRMMRFDDGTKADGRCSMICMGTAGALLP